MFWRRSDDAASTAVIDDNPAASDASAPKGKPTPKRRDAEQARKSALKTPTDTKEAKRAERQRVQAERAKSRQAMMAGDPRALPARDQGPVKLFVRNFIDSRRTAGEFFVPAAVVVLLASLSPSAQIKGLVVLLWMVIMLVVVADTGFLLWRMIGGLKAKWPGKADRRGVIFYAIMRNLQIRRLRIPPPQVRPGGKPVKPKQPKASS